MNRSRRRFLTGTAVAATGLAGCTTLSLGGGRRTLSVETTTEDASALSLDVTVERAAMTGTAPARLRIALTNEDPGPVRYVTGAPRPFGVLTAGEQFLWTDAYRESEHVDTEGRRVVGGEDIGIEMTVGPGAEVAETYEFSAPPGTYTVGGERGGFSVGNARFTVELTVEEG